MDCREVMELLRKQASSEERASLARYGIPDKHALGVPMRVLKQVGKQAGMSHALALELWETGWYEARTVAAFVDEPTAVTSEQMDMWALDFDSWAICDTVCFHLFDRTAYAWEKVAEWASRDEEFVCRAAYALLWALSVHDKTADDARFIAALSILESAENDPRALVKKSMDMALRAVGKRNAHLRSVALEVARRMADAPEKERAWIGRHALRELQATVS